MSTQWQTRPEEDFLLTLDALQGQVFRTPGLRAEQDLLLYFCLQSLWHLMNNAYQGDGERFLEGDQVRQLRGIDARIVRIEARLPPTLLAEVQHCLRRYLAQVDEDPETWA
jgi:hypothetical protein